MATGVELATAWVRIVPSMDGVQGELTKGFNGAADDAAESAGKKAGEKFSTGVKASISLLSAGVVAGVTKMFGDAISNASDLNEAGTAVQAVFGDSTAGIKEWAQTAATGFGQSQLQALNAAKSFGVFGQAAGLTNEENAAFSQGLTELASDFASFHNVSPEEAIEAIGAGLRGEAEPLRKFGVLMDDASLKAKAMEMGIYDGNGSLTQQQKILAANALITEQAGAAQGDFARTSDGLANQQRILDASLTDLSATVGSAFLPVMQGILSIAQPIVQFFQENPSLVIALAVAVGVLTAAIIAANIAMWAMAANPIVLLIMAIVVAVGLLIAAIVWLVLEWDAVVAWITEVWNGLMSWLKVVIDGFVTWWNSVWSGFAAWIGQVWQGFVTWITNIWNGFLNWVRSVVNGFVSWWNSIWEGVGRFFSDLWRNFTLGVQIVWQTFQNWIRGAVNGLVSWWNGIWSTVGRVIETVFGGIGDFIGGIWEGIVGGIRNAVNTIIGIINGVIDGINGIVGAAGAALGLNIHIPHIPMLADGGTITRGGYTIVGEEGPELLKLPRGAQVNPNYDDLPVHDGGVTFNNYAPLGAEPAQQLTRFANRAKGL